MARPAQSEGWDLPEVIRYDDSAPTTALGEGLESVHTSDEALKKSVFSGPQVNTHADKRISGGKEVFTPAPSAGDKYPVEESGLIADHRGGAPPYDGEAPGPRDAGAKRFWTKRKIWIAVGVAVVVVIAIVLGAVLGTVLATDDSGEEESSTSTSSGNGDSTSTSTPTSSAPFGTPTSFSESLKGSDSACTGDICGSILASAATSSSSEDSSFLLIALGNDGEFWYREASEDGWEGDWESLGGNFHSQPAVALSEDGRLDVFGVLDGNLQMGYKTYRRGKWDAEWSNLFGECYSPPAVCGFDDGTVIVYTSSSDNKLAIKRYSNGKWTPGMDKEWQKHTTGFLGSAPAVVCNQEKIEGHIIGFGDDSEDPVEDPREAMIKWGTGFWLDYWKKSGGNFHGDPAAFMEATDTVHVLGFGADDDALYHAVWTSVNATETSAEPKKVSGGGNLMSVPTIFRNHHDQIDVLAVGKDGKLKRNALVDATMEEDGWEDLGGFFSSAPMARLTANSTVSVFGVGPEGSIIHGKWTVNEDHSWSNGEWFDDGGDISTHWYQTQ